MSRFLVIWYGIDRARHAEYIAATNRADAIARALREHDAMSAYIVRG